MQDRECSRYTYLSVIPIKMICGSSARASHSRNEGCIRFRVSDTLGPRVTFFYVPMFLNKWFDDGFWEEDSSIGTSFKGDKLKGIFLLKSSRR